MKIMEEKDPRFMNIERKVGIFILLTIAGLVVIIGAIGVQQDIFTPKSTVYFTTESGTDLIEGMLVKYRGFKIGKVKKVTMNDLGKVEVELSINDHHMKWIRIDSKAKLLKEGFIGDSIIDITPGSSEKPQVEDEGVILFERAASLAEMGEAVWEEVKPVLEDVKKIIEYIENPQGDIKTTLGNVNKLSEGLLTTRENVDTLLTGVHKDVDRITDKVTDLGDNVQSNVDKVVTNVDKTITDVNKDVQGILKNVDEATDNVKQTTADIKKASPKVPEIVDQGKAVMDDTQEIMDSVQDIWLLRPKPVPPEKKMIKVDSYEKE